MPGSFETLEPVALVAVTGGRGSDPAARYRLQQRIQRAAEMNSLLGQIGRLRHQAAMSVINNIR